MADPIDTVVKEIEEQFYDNFSASDIEGQNPPVQKRIAPYAVMFIQPGDYVSSVNGGFHRRVGIVTIMNFVIKGTGTRTIWTNARAAAATLEKQNFGTTNVRFLTGTLQNMGTVGDQLEQDESWYRVDSTISFFYEWFD